MLKKIKEKQFYKKYKELRADPQKNAKMSLIFWVLIFIFTVIVARSIGGSSPELSESVKTIDRYEYTYTNNSSVIFGTIDGNKQVFTILDKKYYYNGKNIYEVKGHNMIKEQTLNLDILKINMSFIDNLTANLSSTKTEDSERFIIPLINFLNLYEEDTEPNLSDAENYNIIVEKYYKNDNLYMVKVNLNSYYQYRNLNDEGILTIDIYNINKTNLLEYERMLEVVE